MTKPFSLLNEFENEDASPAHLKKNQIVSLLKEKFDFENSHLRPPISKEKGILAKCFGYLAPDQAKELGIYPYFREIVYPPVFTLTDTMNPEEDLLKPELL